MRSPRQCAAFFALAAFASAGLGCPNPNTYGTPRTIPAGKISHTIALEGVNLSGNITNTVNASTGQTTTQRGSLTLPTFPGYTLRVGLGSRVDLAAKITNFSMLGADVKWNFLRTRVFDAAIAPGLQGAYSSAGYLAYFHGPLVLGLNAGDSVTFVVTPGVSYLASSVNGTSTLERLTQSALFARIGGGVNLRVSKGFALQPEVTVLQNFDAFELRFITFGLGLDFANLPKYGPDEDVEEDEDGNPVRRPTPNRPAAPPRPGAPAPRPGEPAPAAPGAEPPPPAASAPPPLAPLAPIPIAERRKDCVLQCTQPLRGRLESADESRFARAIRPTMERLSACAGGSLGGGVARLSFDGSGRLSGFTLYGPGADTPCGGELARHFPALEFPGPSQVDCVEKCEGGL